VNLRLLQLASPSLPVGAYSYSQGLEAAVEAGIVHDAASARDGSATCSRSRVRAWRRRVAAPRRRVEAWRRRAARRWNAEFVASRETAELRAETLQMGYSLRNAAARSRRRHARRSRTSTRSPIPRRSRSPSRAGASTRQEALAAYLFAWVENQMLAALKSVPLGQTDGPAHPQGLVGTHSRASSSGAAAMHDDDLANLAPGLAILSSRHETQYSRIFRS
jgi:urease accessory protein